ncbi:hypothetical protein RUM43_008558, partial [Polyplax serrata]
PDPMLYFMFAAFFSDNLTTVCESYPLPSLRVKSQLEIPIDFGDWTMAVDWS